MHQLKIFLHVLLISFTILSVQSVYRCLVMINFRRIKNMNSSLPNYYFSYVEDIIETPDHLLMESKSFTVWIIPLLVHVLFL